MMTALKFLNQNGDFELTGAQNAPEVYFPLVNEAGMISSVTPLLAGDAKTSQHSFLLAPDSEQSLTDSMATRNFWVNYGDGQPWSAVGQSAPQMAHRFDGSEDCTLRGGMLWQSVERTHAATGILARVLSFVPADDSKTEIMQVTLVNTTEESREICCTAAIPLYCRSADNIRDHRHVTSLLHRGEVCAYGLDVTPTLTFDERGHQKNTITYHVWGADEDGVPPAYCVPMTEDYVGTGSYLWPEAVVNPAYACPKSHEGDHVEGGEMTAALFFAPKILEPGQSASYQIVMSIDSNPSTYLLPGAVSAALTRTRRYWSEKACLAVDTGDAEFSGWLRWVSIQPVLRRICGCSFLPHHDYGRGGRGWRDLWQDSLALILTEPDTIRDQLLCHFAGVRLDGTNATIIGNRPGEFKADRNNIPRVWMDHGFWPLFTTRMYLDEAGDPDFLFENQKYFADTLFYRGEQRISEDAVQVREGTVLEHLLLQNITAFFDVGENGNMRLRGADWNDGLDMAAQKGESVAFTAAYAGNLTTLSQLIGRLAESHGELTIFAGLKTLLEADFAAMSWSQKREALMQFCKDILSDASKTQVSADWLSQRLAAMGQYLKEQISTREWVNDGGDLHWFNSYYDNNARPVEGCRDGLVRMMLTGQVFTLMSGTATDEQAAEIVRAVDWYLCDPARGGYFLNTNFEEVRMDLGRMFGFAYGTKENGAVFSHMAVMYAYALYSRGFVEAGDRVLQCLYRQSTAFAQSRILPGIPEYFDMRGRGMYPYLTGAASWFVLTMRTQVFGVRGDLGNLVIEPRLTASQFGEDGSARLSCQFAGKKLTVCFHNPLGLDYGEYQIESVQINGRACDLKGTQVLLGREHFGTEDSCTVAIKLGRKE